MLTNVNTEKILESSYHLEKFVSETNPEFKDLDDGSKALTLLLVKQGQEHLIEDLNRIVYHTPPPTIEEFLSIDSLGLFSHTIFPYWKSRLLDEVFSANSQVNELILTGSTRSGKTTVGIIAQVFRLTRIALMRHPQLMFGISPNSVLALMLITVSLQKANFGLFRPFLELLRTCSYYIEVKKESSFEDVIGVGKIPFVVKDTRDSNSYVILGKNIISFLGSRVEHTLSMSVFGGIMDEADFRTAANVAEEGIDVYLTLRERWRHSFQISRNLLLCLISSTTSGEGVVAKYIESVDELSKEVKIYSPSIWETRDPNAFKAGKFYVFRGIKSIPSKILSPEEERLYLEDKYMVPSGCEILPVPKKYHTDFATGVNRALRNIAGIATVDYDQIFTSLESFDNYDTNLTPEITLESPLGSQIRLITKLDKNIFITYPSGNTKLRRCADVLRYAHIDLAEVNECGVGIVHKELGTNNEELYVTDLVIKIISPTRIDIELVQNLLEDLREKANVRFHKISTDQYQSSQLRQNLEKKRVATEVKHRSVDKSLDSYHLFANLVWYGRFKIGYCPTVREQANALKDINGKAKTIIRKDMTDGLCGAIANAFENTRDVPINRYNNTIETIEEITKNLIGDHQYKVEQIF